MKAVYFCEQCGLPTVTDSKSQHGTYVCRSCGTRFTERPRLLKETGWKLPFFVGVAASAVVAAIVVMNSRPTTAHEASAAQTAVPKVEAAKKRPVELSRPLVTPVAPTPNAVPAAAPVTTTVLTARDVYQLANVSVVTVVSLDASAEKRAIGSGFYVSRDGLIATNLHVVRDSSYVDVISSEGWQVRSSGFVAADPERDLAIISIKRDTLPLSLDTNFPTIGLKVFAVGNPEGFRNTLSEGIVSGRRKLVDVRSDMVSELIQTTAAVSHGSSGGPLISETGSVIGVVSSMWAEGQNINFAIPAGHLQTLLDNRQRASDFHSLPKLLKNHIGDNLAK